LFKPNLLVIAALVAVPALANYPIYRSVGAQSAALQKGQPGTLSIVNNIASFSEPLSDRIGQGDVIQYDTDADGVPDAIAFIYLRNSSTSVEVRDHGFYAAASVASTSQWAIFRAYNSLASAANTAVRPGLPRGGTENPAIDAALRNFDNFVGGKSLVNQENWNFACYDDGVVDDQLVVIGPPWVTDDPHRIRIFTPHTSTEAGLNQRHDGTWGKGYRRSAGIQGNVHDLYLEGLSIRQGQPLGGAADPQLDNRVFTFHTANDGADLRIGDCFGEHADPSPTSSARAFEFVEDQPPGTATTTVRAWNNIGITQATGASGSAAFSSGTSATMYWFNCTASAPNGATAFLIDNAPASRAPELLNALGYSVGGSALLVRPGAELPLVTYSAVNDNSLTAAAIAAGSANNRVNQTFTFVGTNDLHLAPTDLGARGGGANLSADSALPIQDDVDGETRPTLWDIGADQMGPRSVAPDAGTGVDAGLADAGLPPPDAGTTEPFISSLDAGQPPPQLDPPNPHQYVLGFGCSTAPEAIGGWLLLAAATALRARRRAP
jgi:hypothetical protein